MDWRLLALLCCAPVLGACGNPDPPRPPACTLPQAAPGRAPADTRPASADFPFPVMATWIERNRLQASDPASQQLAGTWIHDGDAIAQATRYRRALEAAGYRVGPGRLSGNAQIAFAGTAVVAGRHYRFEIDFAREAGGDQRVTLRFLPAAVPAVNRPTSGRCGRSAATGTHPASPADTS